MFCIFYRSCTFVSMKLSLFYILVCVCLSAFLGACRPHVCPDVLKQADSLASVCPDSARALLVSLADRMAVEPEAVRMYYRLLCIKADDKAYIRHTSDSLILPVLRYYQEKGDAAHLPEVYYYAGRVYCDLGNALQALDYFRSALETIRTQGTEHPLKAKVYSQLGTLYAYQRMYKEALCMYEECLRINEVSMDSVGMIFSLRDVGNMYRELHYPHEVLSYFKKSKRIADCLRRDDLSRMLQSQLVGIYTELQLYDSARVALQDALQQVERPNRSAIYSTAAYFYQAVGEPDSACFYYRKLLECGTVFAQNKAYRALLASRVEQFGDDRLAMLFKGMLQCVDSLQTMSWEANRLQSYANYNYLENERENVRLRELAYQNQRAVWTISVIAVGLLLTLGIVGYRFHHIKRQQEEQQRKLLYVETEKQKRNEMLDSYRQQKESLEEKLKYSTVNTGDCSHIERQKGKIELINHILEQNRVKSEKEMETQQILFNSPLYVELEQRARSVRGEAYVTPEEWDTLRILFDTAYPSFFEHLYFLCTPNNNELHVSMLIRLAFSPADIARLLQLKPSTISSIRVRLYQKTTGKKGKAELWDKIILSL